MMNTVEILRAAEKELEARKCRSAWSRGVNDYAVDLLHQMADYAEAGYITAETLDRPAAFRAAALNGARDWKEYSWGGSALIYDCDIAAALCTPSELKKTRNGERRQNSREEWLDVQARALHQACAHAWDAVWNVKQ